MSLELTLPSPFVARAARKLCGVFSRRLIPGLHDRMHRPLRRVTGSHGAGFFPQALPKDGDLPAGYEVDPSLAPWWQRKLSPMPETARGPHLRQLHDVVVLHNGLVCQGNRILESSSLFHRLTPARILEAAVLLEGSGNFDRVPEAVLVARSTNSQGTFGDYVIEFLLSFAWISPDFRGPYLLDAEFIRRFAPQDLAAKQCLWIEIPAPGFRVRRLTVVSPSQHWDDFLADNIDRVRAHFGVFPHTQPGKKIFLSRLGWKPNEGSKQTRSIANEEEIALFLSRLGFEILRPHTMGNAQVQAAVHSADLVVATHGAAMTHLMFAQPSSVIELASVSWWVPCYLKMARALGVPYYAAIADRPDGCIDLRSISSALDRTEHALRGVVA